MEISNAELRTMLQDAAEEVAKRALIATGNLKPYISKAEAYRIYGTGNVDRWIAESLVVPIKDGTNSSKMRIDRLQIERVASTSNRTSWYNHREAV